MLPVNMTSQEVGMFLSILSNHGLFGEKWMQKFGSFNPFK